MNNNVIATHPNQVLIGDSTEAIDISAAEWREKGFDADSAVGLMPEFADTESGNLRLLPGTAGIDAAAPLGLVVPVDIDGTPPPPRGAGGPARRERRGAWASVRQRCARQSSTRMPC